MKGAKLIASFFGIGYILKGAGTMAALFCCGLWWFCRIDAVALPLQLLLIATVFFIGIFTSNKVEAVWGHDSNRIVIDEVLGMLVSLFLLPHSVLYMALAFILFRLFDITKPIGIRRVEALPGGWGVMIDDAVAGIYTSLLLHVVLFIKPDSGL